MSKRYPYVGPDDIRAAAKHQPPGTPVRTLPDLNRWFATDPTDRTADGDCIVTFTIGEDETLYVAPRRSEHVACASGGPVLSAGEMTFCKDLTILEISNLSTGFCPEPETWPIVKTVLDQIGLEHPATFTNEVTFRLCPSCTTRNIVKDAWFFCNFCDAALPGDWNF